MFIDETVIHVKAGDGGNGCFAYLREKYKPRGRPNGGDGGRGGHIVVQGSAHVQTLLDISYHRSYKAGRGQHGKGSDKFGKNGPDCIIPVPLGTIITDNETGEILYDCLQADQKVIIARGGRGGRGNGSLANRRNPNPDHAEYGKKGEEKELRFVLKVLADIGLVGRPNAGKSTLLATISQARPKIADYPFTTTEPHLGIAKVPHAFDTFVVADIPGLIEDSHTGKGLGIQFLKHIERTKVLAFLIEATADYPQKEADILMRELKQYSPALSDKPSCFILSKMDLVEKGSCEVPSGWFAISSITHTGIQELLFALHTLIKQADEEKDDVLE